MKRLAQYFIIEIKRVFLSLPKILLGSFLLLLLLSASLYIFKSATEQANGEEAVKIGIVAQKDEPFLDWAVDVIKKIPDSGYNFTITRLEEKEAKTAFSKKKANVLLIIPKNYIRSLISGENKVLTVQFDEGHADFVSFVMRELCTAASSFVLDTDAIIYSMKDYYKQYHLPNEKADELKINLQYISEVVSFRDGIEEQRTSPESETPASFYLAAGIVLFLFLWGMMSAPVLTAGNTAFRNQLTLFGIGNIKQNLVKGLSCFLGMFLSLFLFMILFFLIQFKVSLPLEDTVLSAGSGFFLLFISCIPILFSAASFILFLCEAAKDTLSSILLCFFSVFLMGLFSGCLYPIQFLPEAIQKIAVFLPVYHAKTYLLSTLNGIFSIKSLLLLLSDTLIFFFLAAYSDKVSIPKNRKTKSPSLSVKQNRSLFSNSVLVFFLWTKRLFRRPLFVFTLILIPSFTFFLLQAENKDDAMLKIAIYTEKGTRDSLSKEFEEELLSISDKTIRFYKCNTKTKLVNDVSSKKASAGYILPAELKKKLGKYQTGKSPFLKVYRDDETTGGFVTDQILLSRIYPAFAFSLMEQYIQNKKSPVDTDYLKAHYEKYRSHEALFKFSYADGSAAKVLNSDDFSLLLLPLRGIVSVTILLACMAGVFLWYEDREHLFYAVSSPEKRLLCSSFSLLAPGFYAGISGFLSLYYSGITENLSREFFCLMGFLFASLGLTHLFRTLLPSKELFLSSVPVIVTGSLVFCPVFINLSIFVPFVKQIRIFLPSTHYLFALHSKKSLLYLFLYGIICFAAAGIVSKISSLFFKQDFH